MNREQLTATLDPGVATATLSACELPDKDEYTEEECNKFNEARSLVEQGKTYEEVAASFRGDLEQPETNGKGRKFNKGKKAPSPITLSQLLAIASEQVGNRVSLIKAGQLLEACGLCEREDDSYPDEAAACFLEACDMHLRIGKPLAEVAIHFGVPTDSHSEVLELLEQMSGTQIEELKASLIQAKQQQNQQFVEAFHRMTIQKLRQKAESGELQAELQQAWTEQPVGNGFNLLAQVEARMENQKHLPGS